MTAIEERTRVVRYGIRREDGEPWSTEVYELGWELTQDAMIFLCDDVQDLVFCVAGQNFWSEAPLPGKVVPVEAGREMYEDIYPPRFKVMADGVRRGFSQLNEFVETL